MLTSVAGVGIAYQAGEIYDLDDKLARAFVTLPEDQPRAEVISRKPFDRRETRKAA